MLKFKLDAPTEAALLEATGQLELPWEQVQSVLGAQGVVMDDTVVKQCCAALTAGFHLLLVGPPGTGKTTLAEALARVAGKVNALPKDAVFTTGTSDWTTFETIGGYMPDPEAEGRTLRFEPGQFLQAIASKQWLIVDELNRADIDKALGPLFTVLSGKPTTLPYKDDNLNPITVGFSPDAEPYRVSRAWRMIGTMNTFDKLSLFRLSYAFQRRFVQVYVGLPANYRTFVKDLCEPLVGAAAAEIGEFFAALAPHREMGPAIPRDMARYLKALGGVNSANMTAALNAFVTPQLDGLPPEDMAQVVDVITAHLSAYVTVSVDDIRGEMLVEPVVEDYLLEEIDLDNEEQA